MPDEYYFKEGCYIQEWHNIDQDEECSIVHVRVQAKQKTRLHALKNTQERYVILSGQARVTVAAKSWIVKANDVIHIASDTPQQIENLLHQDLLFLAICTPRFSEENYSDLEA